jgi:radical SAM superfamily enzyme YgiQ (UPF0313 family)
VEPFAIEVLAGSLADECPSARVDMVVIDQSQDSKKIDDLLRTLRTAKYDIIGFSIPQGTLKHARQILDQIDTLFNDANRPIVLLGHALPSNAPETFLQRYPWSICVRGWGEDALKYFVDHRKGLDLTEAPGIYYAQSGMIFSTQGRWELEARSPARINSTLYFNRIESSRGCSYNKCTYCLRPMGSERILSDSSSWHRMPIEQTLHSIESLKRTGITHFTFADEDFFGADLSEVELMAQRIFEIGGMSFTLSAMIDDFYKSHATDKENWMRQEILKLLQQAGLSLVYCGLESVVTSQLRRYGKRTRAVSDLVKAVKLAKDLRLKLELGFIMFDPFVSLRELRGNVQVLESTGLWQDIKSILSFLNVYSHTPYETWVRRENLLGEFDLDSLTYEWSYANETVARIAEKCLQWRMRFHPVYSALRHVERTDLASTYADRFLRLLRYQDLMFLKTVLNEGSEFSNPGSTKESIELQRMSLLRDLYDHLQTIPWTQPDELLISELTKCL